MRSCAYAFFIGTCWAVTIQAQVPVHEEPLHRPVFTNAVLRIIDLSLQPGQASLDHVHSNDAASVSISASESRVRTPGAGWAEPRALRPVGEIQISEYAGQPGTHAVQNVGKNLYRVIGVHNLKQSGWSTGAAAAAGGPVTLLKSTRAFHTYAVRLATPKQEVDRVHDAPTVVVLSAGSATVARGGVPAVRLNQSTRWVVVGPRESYKLIADTGDVQLAEIEVR